MDTNFNPREVVESLVGEEVNLDRPVFPKYQWSIFAGEGKNEQYVVRENDMNQFKIAVNAIKNGLNLRTQVAPVNNQPVYDNLTSICATHNVPMVQKMSKAGTPYWSHDGLNGEGKCFGKGYLPPKQ